MEKIKKSFGEIWYKLTDEQTEYLKDYITKQKKYAVEHYKFIQSKNKLKSLDNISNEILDLLKEKFSKSCSYEIIDKREEKEYFLLRYNDKNKVKNKPEITFIWLKNNLWQFNYANSKVYYEGLYKSPLDILNELLKN